MTLVADETASPEKAVAATQTVTGAPAAIEPPLRVTNLHTTLPELARLAGSALDQGAWLDGFLLAAGMSQLIEDYLQPDPLSLRRAGSFLSREGGALGRLMARTIAAPGADVLARLSGWRPRTAVVRRLERTVAAAVPVLADLAVARDPVAGDPSVLRELASWCASLDDTPSQLPAALRDDLVRLPACYRSFDQHPDDLRRLVDAFAPAHPDRDRPLLTVGVRTSGSYLAPLCGAHLRAAGYSNVNLLTMRPGRPLPASARARLAALAQRDALALVCDDPPVTGGAIAAVAAQLGTLGIPQPNILLLLALFPDVEDPPPALASYDCLVLRYRDWSIHERMGADGIRALVGPLLGTDRELVAVTPVCVRPSRRVRGHRKAVLRLTLADARTGERIEEDLSVEGVGLGYFGEHAAAVAELLPEFLPPVLGVRDGLLFRAWLPEQERADLAASRSRAAIASRVADYVHARARRLPLGSDLSLRQGGDYPAWEAASTVISRSFGRAWPIGRTLITDRAVKRILRVAHPSVIDGRTELAQWFIEPPPRAMVKVDWDQGDSWNLGLSCCDPVFDLAGVTAASQDTALAGELCRAYAGLAGARVDEERWLLYQLAHLSAGRDAQYERSAGLDRACARALQNYFRAVYFDDLSPGVDGPLCGIDIDGVLETEHLGFPALTPASALGLRSLLAHGYRPLTITGRSLQDVIDRCRAYRLAGGVAEYGSAIYRSADGLVAVVAEPAEQAAIDRLRSELRGREGVFLDEDYTHAVRAFVRGGRGERRPLPPETIADAQRAADAWAITVIRGDGQTDFVPERIDKGRGTLALALALGAPATGGAPSAPGAPATDAAPLAFAVGDTVSDVPMLSLAREPFVAGHAADSLAEQFSRTRASYQRGFAEAVGRLVGHPPGGCEHCRLGALTPERRRLLGLIAVRETRIGRLGSRLARPRAPR